MKGRTAAAVMIAAMMLTIAVIPYMTDGTDAEEAATESVGGGTGILPLDIYLLIIGNTFIDIGNTIRGWGGFEPVQTNAGDSDEG